MSVLNLFKRTRLRTQLILGVAFVHAVLMAFFVWDLSQRQEETLYRQAEDSATHLTRIFADSISLWVASNDFQAVGDALKSLKDQVPNLLKAEVFDSRGQILAHTDPAQLGRYVADEAAVTLLRTPPDARVLPLHMDSSTFDLAAPVYLQDRIVGWVRLLLDERDLAQANTRVIVEGVAYTLFAIAVGSLLAWLIGRTLTHRLQRLERVAEQVAAGERSVQLEDEPGYADELAHLAASFQSMLAELQNKEQALIQAHDRLKRIFDMLPLYIVELDENGHIEYANPRFYRIANLSPAHRNVPFEQTVQLVSTETDTPISMDRHALALVNRPRQFSARLEGEGREEAVDVTLLPISDEVGRRHVILLMQPEEGENHLLQEIAWQQRHDPLTGLLNRQGILAHLEQMRAGIDQKAPSEDASWAVQLNLDHFRAINEMLGFAGGDEVLQIMAVMLSQHFADKGVLGRLGGDDFVFVSREPMTETGIRELVAGFQEKCREPILINGRRISLDASGVALALQEAGMTPEEILLKLDFGMQELKRSGRGQFVVLLHDTDALLDRKLAQVGWLHEVKKALQENRVALVAQPIVSLQPPFLRKAEALVRIRDDQGELVAPYHFLPVAEQFGLMPELEMRIFEKALDWLNTHGATIDQLNLNISAATLTSPLYRDALIARLKRLPVAHVRKLCFEVTESAHLGDLQETRALLEQLDALGCKLAIDDFGSGYASFNYLKALPVDYVKIDGEFIKGMLENPVDRAMVEATARICREMRLTVVAEYVENAELVRLLRSMGIAYGQGYYFSAPVELDVLLSEDFWTDLEKRLDAASTEQRVGQLH